MLWLVVPLGVLIGVVGLGGIYQALATSRDSLMFLPPGKLIQIKDKNWHCQIMGKGHPTVIVDSGTGGTHRDWQLVQPEVAKFTKILTYDRAGYGWSAVSSEPRTAQQVVSELRQLLRQVEIEPPYVLVGMSLSGLFSRLFAYHYPEEVAGMVLVDVAHEKMYEETSVEWVELNKRLEGLLTYVVPIIGRIGLLRLLITFDSVPMAAGLFQKFPPSIRPLAKALYSQTQFGKTFAQESAAVSVSMNQVKQIRQTKPFPDIPLVNTLGVLPLERVVNLIFPHHNWYQEFATNIAKLFIERMVICMQHKPCPPFPPTTDLSTGSVRVSKGEDR
jgi:pimeloyl-ACP methyl ester carboxylesterase